jgi:prephenate dehydrogenase
VIRTVSIHGLGLMGGSLGLALKQVLGDAVTVHGYTRSVARGEAALARGAIDVWHEDAAASARAAQVVVLCAPICAIPDQLAPLVEVLGEGAVVTDVGSTKEELQRICTGQLAGRSAVFVGSHPIAGSEQQGIEAARSDLYQKSVTVITPDAATPDRAVALVRDLWTTVGSTVVATTPAEHDRLLAATSHLPHLIAGLLALTVAGTGGRTDIGRFCGSGFRDTTRIAEGGIEIWRDILATNRSAILEALTAYRGRVDGLMELLAKNDGSGIEAVLKEAKAARRAVIDYGNKT